MAAPPAYIGPHGFESISHAVFWRAVVADHTDAGVRYCRLRRTEYPETDRCSICLCEREAMIEPVAVTRCWHAFCRPCLVSWILSRRHALARGAWDARAAPPAPLPSTMSTPCPLCLGQFEMPVRVTSDGASDALVWFEANNDCCFSAAALQRHEQRLRDEMLAARAADAAQRNSLFAESLASTALLFVDGLSEVIREAATEALNEARSASSADATPLAARGAELRRPWDRSAKRARVAPSDT